MKQRPVRKLLALVLSLLLVFAFTPVAFAVEGESDETLPETIPVETTEQDPAGAEAKTEPNSEVTGVAKIGETQYQSLKAAFDAVQNGQTIDLIADGDATGIVMSNKNITLNLNGYTVTDVGKTGAEGIFQLKTDATLNVVGPGAITSTVVDASKNHAFRVEGGSKLNIGSGVNVSTVQCCVFIKGDGTELVTAGNLTSSGYYTVSGNHAEGVLTHITVNGGRIDNTYADDAIGGFAIYQPQDGDLTINSGTISGNNGIGIKSGTLTVNGGIIEAHGQRVNPSTSGNGINGCGSAIVIDSADPYEGATIDICGGKLSSDNAVTICEYGPNADKLKSISISDDAELSSSADRSELYIEHGDGKVTVSGGVFSKDVTDTSSNVSKYLDKNAIVVKVDNDERYHVGTAAEEAVKSAQNSVTVINGTEITGVQEGVKVTNNTDAEITVDGTEVGVNTDYTVPTTQEPEPSNPSSSFTEPEYYPDYDEDVDYLPPAEDEEEEEKAPLYMVTCRTLNVRMGPGTSYAKLGTLSRGTLISGEYENGWVKFTYNGQTAYSSADYLMQVDGDLSGLHVTCRTLNVRAGAGTNFDILGTLSRGTEISVRDVLPGWYEIDFLGGIGYVSSAYIG